MTMSAEHRSKFAARHRQWSRLREIKVLEWDEKPQTNKIKLKLLGEMKIFFSAIEESVILEWKNKEAITLFSSI